MPSASSPLSLGVLWAAAASTQGRLIIGAGWCGAPGRQAPQGCPCKPAGIPGAPSPARARAPAGKLQASCPPEPQLERWEGRAKPRAAPAPCPSSPARPPPSRAGRPSGDEGRGAGAARGFARPSQRSSWGSGGRPACSATPLILCLPTPPPEGRPAQEGGGRRGGPPGAPRDHCTRAADPFKTALTIGLLNPNLLTQY